jgi:hypothetical protein
MFYIVCAGGLGGPWPLPPLGFAPQDERTILALDCSLECGINIRAISQVKMKQELGDREKKTNHKK